MTHSARLDLITTAVVVAVLGALAPTAAQEGADEERRGSDRRRARSELSKIARDGGALVKEGEVAPAFSLPLLEGSLPPADVALQDGKKISLVSLHDDRPVVLIFGSYT